MKPFQIYSQLMRTADICHACYTFHKETGGTRAPKGITRWAGSWPLIDLIDGRHWSPREVSLTGGGSFGRRPSDRTNKGQSWDSWG